MLQIIKMFFFFFSFQVRHIKLVHSQNQSSSTSPSLGEGGESLIHNDDTNKQHPATSYRYPSKLNIFHSKQILNQTFLLVSPLKLSRLMINKNLKIPLGNHR